MPELPEVETTRLGIEPHIIGQKISQIIVRERRLRWAIPDELDVLASEQHIKQVKRRAKYLLIELESGTIIIHLGMSGSLRVVEQAASCQKHDRSSKLKQYTVSTLMLTKYKYLPCYLLKQVPAQKIVNIVHNQAIMILGLIKKNY